MLKVPSICDVRIGFGVGADRLFAFHKALEDCGIGHINIVPVSSVLPPAIEFKTDESIRYEAGRVVPAIVAVRYLLPDISPNPIISHAILYGRLYQQQYYLILEHDDTGLLSEDEVQRPDDVVVIAEEWLRKNIAAFEALLGRVDIVAGVILVAIPQNTAVVYKFHSIFNNQRHEYIPLKLPRESCDVVLFTGFLLL